MTEIATRDASPAAVVQQYRADFAAVLPSHIKSDAWVRLAVGALRRDRALAQAASNDVAALLSALLTAARLGLEPGTEEFYLTRRRDKGVDKVLGIVGYRGEIELIYRAGAVSSVIVEAVREHDRFEYRPGVDERPRHEVDWFGDRGEVRGAYAYAVMKDGATSKVVVIGPKEIATAKAASAAGDSPHGPWVKHFEAMVLKTAVHRLAKFVPTSAEYIREQLRAVRDVTAETPAPAPGGLDLPLPAVDLETGEIVDAELVEDGDPS